MLKRGYRIVADDVCPINAGGHVIAGMPRIKIWQKSADLLGIDTSGMARIRPNFEKFNLPLIDTYCSEPRAVKAVIVLAQDNTPDVRIEDVTGKEKFQILRHNTFRPNFVTSMGLNTLHFKQVMAFASGIPVKCLTRPKLGDSISKVLDIIESLCHDVGRT